VGVRAGAGAYSVDEQVHEDAVLLGVVGEGDLPVAQQPYVRHLAHVHGHAVGLV